MPTDDSGASPAVCPRCGRVEVDCEDKAAVERAATAAAGCRNTWIERSRLRAAIRAFLGCPK